jgi:hypothetical protein
MKNCVLILAIALIGCGEYKTVPMQEDAKVVDTIYAPSQHGSGVSPGMSMSGNLTISYTNVDIPPKWAVVFECQHGKFITEGSDSDHKNLWNSLKAGDSVTVNYNEVFYRGGDDEAWRLHDYDFISATKK